MMLFFKQYFTYKTTLRFVLIILLTGILFSFLSSPGSDWLFYLRASALYRNSMPVYNVWIKQYGNSAVFYLYSPLFVFAMQPLTYVPMLFSLLLWSLLKLFLLYRVFIIVALMLDFNELPDRKKAAILLISFLFILRFLLYDFNLGNITVFLLWCMVEGWHQITLKNKITGTLLLAIPLFIKTVTLIFFPYLIYKRRFRELSMLLMWALILSLVPFVFGRWNYNASLYHDWLGVINPLKFSAKIAETNTLTYVHDLHSAIPAWYAMISLRLHPIINFKDLTTAEIVMIVYAVIFLFIAAFLFIPRTKFFSKYSNPKTELSELGYIIGLIPLIFPMQQKHGFIFMIPLIIYVINFLVTLKLKAYQIFLCALSFSLMVLTTDGIIGRRLNYITQELKFITIGAIIFIVLLFLIKWEEEKSISPSQNN